MFAIELMLPEVSVDTFLPVAIATGAATFVGRWFFGDQPAFQVPSIVAMTPHANTVWLLLLYTLLGALVGVAAAGFVRGIHIVEDAFDRIPWRYARHMLGMLLVGVLMYALFRAFGQYYVDGVGYSTIESILVGNTSAAWLLGLLFVCKLLATSISLGSGSSGGIFSPSLFMGATLGGGFASLLAAAGLPMPLSVPAFAMVGMGAMVGGGTGAVMTAVTMIFEMTRDYDIVMPLILAVAASVGVRRLLSAESIYTLKLVRRGRMLPKALHANMFLVRHAREVMDPDVLVLPAETSFDSLLREHEAHGRLQHVVVTQQGRLYGVIRVNTGLWRGLEGAQHAGDPGRRGHSRLHRRARRRDRLRCHRKDVAQTRLHGDRRQGPRSSARRRRRGRHHQGARRQLGGEQHEDLSELMASGSELVESVAIDRRRSCRDSERDRSGRA